LNPHLTEICGLCEFEFFNRIDPKPSFDGHESGRSKVALHGTSVAISRSVQLTAARSHLLQIRLHFGVSSRFFGFRRKAIAALHAAD
jgi:hypothetical protein